MVGNVSARLTEKGSGIDLNPAQIGMAAAFYIAGACLGALFFGHLTDRFGRRNLFMLTLAVYLVATVATAFAFAPGTSSSRGSSPAPASAANTPRSTRPSTS